MAVESKSSSSVGNLIFLSYRRKDSAAYTLGLKVDLENKLRAVQVFMDDHAIEIGDTFPTQIDNALATAKVFIAIIGPEWEGKTADGGRRIDLKADWVRREIEFALNNRADALLPVLIDNRQPLRSEELPSSISAIASIQALHLELSNWDNSISNLIRTLYDKFQLQPKLETYVFPKPDPLKAKTIPYPWEMLELDVLTALPSWSVEFSDDPVKLRYKRVELRKDFEFKTYERAVEFVNLIARHSTEVDHHPRMLILWRTVTVWTSTWDAGHRITSFDVEFVRFLERKYREFNGRA